VALDRSLVDAHPAARMIKRFKERPSDRVLSDDELRALWAGLEARPGPAADAMKVRLLLGQRGGEVTGMRWEEVDLKAGVWHLPGARTKNGRPHSVPLPPTVLALLECRRGTAPADAAQVFPGLTQWSDEQRELSAIHGGAYTWKDLRRTVSTRVRRDRTPFRPEQIIAEPCHPLERRQHQSIRRQRLAHGAIRTIFNLNPEALPTAPRNSCRKKINNRSPDHRSANRSHPDVHLHYRS
jgi:integrase